MNIRKISLFLTPAIVILTTIVLIGKASERIVWDQLQYLTIAKHVVSGQGFHDLTGEPLPVRPAYVLLLASIGYFSEITPRMVIWLDYFIFSLFVLSIFYVSRKLYNLRTAIFAVVFFLTVPEIVIWGHQNLDSLWPLCVMLSLILLTADTDGHELLTGILAGLLVAFGFLVKEWTICFVPVPIVLRALKLVDAKKLRIPAFYLAFTIPVLIWAYYVVYVMQFGVKGLLGGMDYGTSLGKVAGGGLSAQSIYNVFVYFVQGSVKYFYNPGGRPGTFVFSRLPFAPLMGLAMIWSVWRALSKSDRSGILLVIVLAFMPFSAIVANYEFRYQQNLLSISIFFIICAAFFDGIIRVLEERVSFIRAHYAFSLLASLPFIIIVAFPIFFGTVVPVKVATAKWLLQGHAFETAFWGSAVLRRLDDTIPAGAVVMVYDRIHTLNRGIFLFGKKRFTVTNLPVKPYDAIPPSGEITMGAVLWRLPPENPLCDEIGILDEEAFLSALKEKTISTLVIEQCEHPLLTWVDTHLNVTAREHVSIDGYDIIHIEKDNPVKDFSHGPIYISSIVTNRLPYLRKEDPVKYARISRLLFDAELHSGVVTLESLADSGNDRFLYSRFALVD